MMTVLPVLHLLQESTSGLSGGVVVVVKAVVSPRQLVLMIM